MVGAGKGRGNGKEKIDVTFFFFARRPYLCKDDGALDSGIAQLQCFAVPKLYHYSC